MILGIDASRAVMHLTPCPFPMREGESLFPRRFGEGAMRLGASKGEVQAKPCYSELTPAAR